MKQKILAEIEALEKQALYKPYRRLNTKPKKPYRPKSLRPNRYRKKKKTPSLPDAPSAPSSPSFSSSSSSSSSGTGFGATATIQFIEQRLASSENTDALNLLYRDLRDSLLKHKAKFSKMETGPDKDDFEKAITLLRQACEVLENWF